MTAINKDSYFKKNPGGSGPTSQLTIPGANGTWANYVTNNEATQASAQVAAGYLSFDDVTSASDDTLTEYRIPVYKGG